MFCYWHSIPTNAISFKLCTMGKIAIAVKGIYSCDITPFYI